MKKFAFLLAVLVLFSCGSKEDKIEKEFSKKGTVDLMEEIEKDEYSPPKDGKLTEKQVEMYIAVKQEELAYAKQAAENLKEKAEKLDDKEKQGKKPGLGDYMTAFKAMGDVADFVTADLRAAKKLGYNAKEYQWVRETIVANTLAVWQDTTRKSSSKMYSEMLDQLKKQRESATSEDMKKMYDQQIKSMSEGVNEMNKVEEDERVNVNEFNQKLLMKYKEQIQGLDTELKKWRMLNNETNPEIE